MGSVCFLTTMTPKMTIYNLQKDSDSTHGIVRGLKSETKYIKL